MRRKMTPSQQSTPSDQAVSGALKSSLRKDIAAWFTSLSLHSLLLIFLAVASMVIPGSQDGLELAYNLPELLEEEPLPQEFLSSEVPMEEIGALSQAEDESSRAAAVVIDDRSLVIFEPEEVTDLGERMVIEVDAPVFQGPQFSEELPVQGAGSVGTSGALGAIDRMTHEIMISVEQQPTLVVWLFDQSGSLREEREKILARFHNVYDQLGVIEASENPAFKRHKDKPLLTAIVSFGEEPHMLTDKPTDKIEEIETAVEAIADDDSGRENVFRAIASSAEKFRSYRLSRHGDRNVMLVVFTDESGDDVEKLDATVDLCRKLAMPVYVIGRPAPFGRESAYVKWIDPDPTFDQRPQWVPVNLGPESLLPERLKLHFLGVGKHDELLDSGYGPYALTRLCYETGGLYFSTHPNRTVGRHISGRETSNLSAHFTAFFDPEVMRKYQPDYVTVKEYMQQLGTNRTRGALVSAAQLSWTSPIEDVRTRFLKLDEATLATSLSLAQRAAAIRQPKIDQICQILFRGEDHRTELRSPRWEAGYDLALGRAVAMKVRTDGYNAMLAHAKQGMIFKNEKNNTWILVSDTEFANSSLEKLADKAELYLRRVMEDHNGTPWAMLAARELRSPLGWRWKESYTNIPEPRQGDGNNRRRPEMPRGPTGPSRRNPPPL